MPYLKIRLDSTLCSIGRFYRTLLVKKDLNLFSFGIAIAQSFKAVFNHSFDFETEKYTYFPPYFCIFDKSNRFMHNHTVEDLGNKFIYCYDLGDSWNFIGKVYPKEINKIYRDEFDEEKEVVLIDGAGQVIWEDNIRTF